jgi:1,4-alpha-glucan branching enzyme
MSSPAPQLLPHASQAHIDSSTPMGATLTEGGATFRVWAPGAIDLYVITDDLPRSRERNWIPRESDRLLRQSDGTWTGFITGIKDGTPYRYYVVGEGGSGFKRDPWARELGTQPAFPDCDCLVRDPESYPWHDSDVRPVPFPELIVYQLHIGAFYRVDAQGNDQRQKVGRFLDVIARIRYLRELGVNAVQLLPIQEFPHDNSLGYNNVDFFSPEMAYQVEDPEEIRPYLDEVKSILSQFGKPPLELEQLSTGPNQLKALVDLLHLNGIAVILDLVYNHAGGGFDPQSLYFFDRRANTTNNNSLYFTDQGWAGGLVFAYWNAGVQDFLIRNATFFLSEYHVDGFRFDEVSVIDSHGGWSFCQDLTNTLHFVKPGAIQIAEYWNSQRELAVESPDAGMGFDAAWADGLRDALRGAVGQASGGRDAFVNFDAIRDHLYPPYGFGDAWRSVNCIENHDIVYADRKPDELKPRVAALADPSNARSWYARSRSRFATALLMTASGIPMLFMGEEILEDKNWSDNPKNHGNTLVWWDGLTSDPAMRDFLEFVKTVIRLRKTHRALSGPEMNAFHVNNAARVIGFHRWLEGVGEDLVVVGTLSEVNLTGYEIGFPLAGIWREVFNSDFFESSPGHQTSGNAGQVVADGPPLHGLPSSARITIPANGLLVFAR